MKHFFGATYVHNDVEKQVSDFQNAESEWQRRRYLTITWHPPADVRWRPSGLGQGSER
jgi:hypothetical protein